MISPMNLRTLAAATVATAATATALTVGLAGPAAADYQGPGSCLVVQNHTGNQIELRLNYPTEGGSWTFYPYEDPSLLTDRNDNPIYSPTGEWSVHTEPAIDAAWSYEPGRNSSRGCNGSWIMTIN